MPDRIFSATLRKIRSDEGQIFVLAAFSLTVLLGFIAFATDLGIMLHERRVLQTAADSAAIAGAAQLANTASRPGGGATPCNISNDNCWYYAAIADAEQNGIPTSGVTPSNPPASGPNSGSSSYVQVVVTHSQPTFFMKLFNISSMNVSARAVATNTPQATCLYTLKTSGVDISSGGGTSLSLPSCSIMDASTSSPSITTNGGGSVSAPAIYLPAGGGVSGTVTAPTHVSTPITDPLAGTFTAPRGYTCGTMPGSSTIGPSTSTGVVCYTGMTFSSSGNITLNPGIYVVNGNFKTTGSVNITGTGVTLYLLNGSFSLGGSGTVTLSPPGVGSAYNNVVIYQPPSNTNTISFGGTGNANVSGIIYATKASVSLGGSGGGNLQVDFIIDSLSLSGNSTINPYVPIYGGPLTDARLVE